MSAQTPVWRPSTERPEGVEVIVKQTGYAITEAIYCHQGLPMAGGGTLPPGFYLCVGDGKVLSMPGVEWWIPMPAFPTR